MRAMLRLICFFENLVFYVVMPWIPFFSIIFPGIKKQFAHSRKFQSKNELIQKQVVLFFCSSSGELEQAFPIIDRFKQQGFYPVVFMQSISGLLYVKAIQSDVEIYLCPLDTILAWQKIFDFFKPTYTIVVRHEFWPSFIEVASRKSKIFLINYSEVSNTMLSQWSRAFFLHFFQERFAVTDAKHSISVKVIGDTKYDRVLERAKYRKTAADSHKLFFESKFGKKKFMIIGSAWEWDIMHCINAYLSLDERDKWIVLIVPHEIQNAELYGSMLDELEIDYRRYSRLEHAFHSHCVIVDQLGLLAELYGIASACLIGGAFHAKIHNILEPAAWDLPIAHGPYFRAQQEAIEMVEAGISTPVHNAMELTRWWNKISKLPPKSSRAFVESKAGASDRFMACIDASHTKPNDTLPLLP